MAFNVKAAVRQDVGVGLQTAIREGLATGGQEVLDDSNRRAPREPGPHHQHPGVHGVDTGFVRVLPGVDTDAVQVGYNAFWMRFQHEHTEWHHPNGGQAKFLETALVQGVDTVLAHVAVAARKALGL